jgi:lysozyme
MRTSAEGRAFIGRHEGLRLTAYRDAAGVWTIGYGHTAAAGPPVPVAGLTITAGEADTILARDLSRFEAAVTRLVTVPLSQGAFDALVSFTFNVGEGALARSTLLKKLNAGDRAGAAAEFGRWNKAGGRVLVGLTRRRAEERALFERGGVGEGAQPAAPAPVPTAVPVVPGPVAASPAVEPPVALPQDSGASTPELASSGVSTPEPAPPEVAAKPALASKAVWGGLVAVAAALLPVLGPALGLEAADQGEVLELLAALGGVAGGALAIWGRVTARQPIRRGAS